MAKGTEETFSGVPFDFGSPYDQEEALAVLGSLVAGLRKRLASSTILEPIESEAPAMPRPSTSHTIPGFWDVITFKYSGQDVFNQHPHLTISISDDTSIQVILPNDARKCWRRLAAANEHQLDAVLSQVTANVRRQRHPLGGGIWEPQLFLDVVQRHFHARRYSNEDGRMRFDLDTRFPGGVPAVKGNPAWLKALMLVVDHHRSANMQLALRLRYPFAESSISRTPQFLEEAAKAAEAMQPFVAFLKSYDN